MRFKRAMAASMAAVMAVSSAAVCQVTASAAAVQVAADKEISSWGSAAINLAAEGTPAAGATVTITLEKAVTESNGWGGQTVFKILSTDWSTEYVNETVDANQTSKTSFTYSIDDDFNGATGILIQSGISDIKISVSVSEVVSDSRSEADAAYDGSPITMVKSYPDWAGSDGAAQANYPLSIDLGGAKTYGEIKAEFKNLVVSGIDYVNDSLGGSAGDYTYCLYAKWGEDSSIWSSSGSDSLSSEIKWGVDGISSSLTDDTVLSEFGIQINVSNMSDAVKALKDGETFIINPAEEVGVESVTIDKTNVKSVYNVGDTFKLSAAVTPDDAADPTVTWSTSNDKAVTVDENGNVEAVGAGKAVITAAAGDKTDTVEITVEKKKVSANITAGDVDGAATSDAADKAEAAVKASVEGLTEGKDYTVDVALSADKKSYTATISLTEAAAEKYELDGTVSAEGKISYTVTGLVLSKTKIAIPITSTAGVRITATIQPEELAEGEIEWSTADNTVATVDDGLVQPVSGSAGGKTVITAKVKGTTISADCEVEITEVVNPAAKIELDKTELTGTEGGKASLTAKVTASDPSSECTDIVEWESSDESVATVKDGTVSFVGKGNAVITAKAGDKSAECKVTVEAAVVAVEKITLDKTAAELTEGDTTTLTASVTPDSATDKTVTWTSSDESVATVKDGVVTAVKAGKAVITAEAGGKTAACTVTVKAKADTPSGNENEIWSGNTDLGTGWDKNVTVPKANVKIGDVIRIKVSTGSAEYHQIKIMDSSWNVLSSLKGRAHAEYGTIDVDKDGYVEFTVNAADAKLISEGGLIISGYDLTISSVSNKALKDETMAPSTKVKTVVNNGTSQTAIFAISEADADTYESYTVIITRGSDDKSVYVIVDDCYKYVTYNNGTEDIRVSGDGAYYIMLDITGIEDSFGGITVRIVPSVPKG